MKHSVVRELRAVERFAVSLPVSLNWQATGKQGRQERAFTRDISTRGMFVFARTGPSKGRRLEFEIDLELDGYSPLMQVKGEGRVVRVERPAPESGLSGFAVVNLCFKLCQPEKGAALPAKTRAQAGRVARAGTRIHERALPKRFAPDF